MAVVLPFPRRRRALVLNDGWTWTMYNVHSARSCAGRTCVVHNPSNHVMREWNLTLNGELMMRECSHGYEHPDPDSLAYLINLYPRIGEHYCDGCCADDA